MFVYSESDYILRSSCNAPMNYLYTPLISMQTFLIGLNAWCSILTCEAIALNSPTCYALD